ncbi:hypothetical protein [Microbispora sp. NBC_01389]|uniref:hypothetical protein n=1 Tax=Microbispora sp. NBC_01389 TaxID=2903584 RepID=UPI0032539536
MAERRPLIARRLRPGHWVAVDAFAAVALAAGFSVAAVFAPFAGWEEAFVPLAVALHAVALLEARRTAVAALMATLAVAAAGAGRRRRRTR